MLVHDLIGIGFGPSNIALAIALEEARPAAPAIKALFIEQQPGFAWHPDMMLGDAHMQIAFLKDLATLRNPTSRYTFVNYLHEKQRLQDFINLKTFYPSRHEFSDYFAWAAGRFAEQVAYGESVVDVQPEVRGGNVELLRIKSRDQAGRFSERLTRNLVVSIGGTPRMPPAFHPCAHDDRIFHTHHYLRRIQTNAHASRIALIGGGQSAAEIFLDLHGRANAPQVDLIMRARALKPADSSPYVNEVFNSEFVDHVFSQPTEVRDAMLAEFRHTNYACPDPALIDQIFKIFYEQRVRGDDRHRFLRRHDVKEVRVADEGVYLTLFDHNTTGHVTQRYDAVVLATGYERQSHRTMLAALAPYAEGFEVDRGYRLKTVDQFKPAVYLQGSNEPTHGLSDTLLSVTSVRGGEIAEGVLAAVKASRMS